MWELPKLDGPGEVNPALRCSDWLHRIQPSIHDLAPKAHGWWSLVLTEAKEAYNKWLVVCHAVGKDIDKGNSFGGAEVREVCPLRESCAGDAVEGSASNDLRLRTECAQHHVLRDRLLCAKGISTGWTSRTDRTPERFDGA